MEELKDNFDTASVVGYFMEGKLETWLNDRYYEEEAEQVAALSKDDPALARKLCAVFGIVSLGKAENFCIAGRKLYVYSREKSEIYECNLDGEKIKTVMKEVPFITGMHYRNGSIYTDNWLDGILFRKRGESSFQIKV